MASDVVGAASELTPVNIKAVQMAHVLDMELHFMPSRLDDVVLSLCLCRAWAARVCKGRRIGIFKSRGNCHRYRDPNC